MADEKKVATRQPRLGSGDEWHEPPTPVQDCADEYAKLLRAKNKASEKAKNGLETLKDMMKKHKVTLVKIDNGAKLIELVEDSKIVIKPIKGQSSADDAE